ncbi:MAG: inositol monophosphatase family protein [Vulcanimicrobiaceae bacterium]
MDPLQCAIETAKAAGDLLLERVGMPLETREKGLRGDLVTASDRASEALIVARLRAAFPRASVLGEEGGATAGASDERWIVDPLDGTTNYAHDYPMYCVSIAYERAGDVVAAAIYAPALREMYAAASGSGATLNGVPIAVSHTETIARSLVCTGFVPARYERNGEHFARLSRRAQGVRRDGSAALDLAFVAAGRFDGFWEFDLHAWDVAAGALIVREAGGTVSAIDGGPFDVAGASILASNGAVHAELRAALSQ